MMIGCPGSVSLDHYLYVKIFCYYCTCFVAFGESGDKIVSISLGGSLYHSLPGGISKAVGDVLLNCPSKKHRLLANKSHLETQNEMHVFTISLTNFNQQ